ncbi:MAG TPA: TlpA disulfide reductase family protein [Verrucomicrobiae bacterium]|nr:TlpA disulfide reductase family protein [Verrucomicrobiae bacterium]
MEVLRNQYTTYPDLGRVCRTLAFGGDLSDQPTREFLQIASTKNPNRTARGFATFALARLTKESAEGRAFFEAVPPSIYTNAYANVAAAEAAYERESKAGSSQTVFRQAEQLFETVAKKYADCPNFESGPGLRQPKPTLGDQAVVELYECRHLTPGKVAPEIEGEDLNGLLIRLSDYRGKVVVLSFWASWCGPCMQMMPHERAMAQRLESKSFAFVGVNGDALQADAKRAVTKSDITWPSFWNGKEGPWSGIAADWNVKGWPTVFVLDSRGTIRLKLAGYGGQRTDSLLDEFVDRLLKETGDKHG